MGCGASSHTPMAQAVASTSDTQQDGAFPRRGVRLAWLRQFVDACKGKKYKSKVKSRLGDH